MVAGLGGTELGEHGWADSLYAPYVRVPLIFHHPATVPGRRYSASLISLEDLAPTALHWLRLEGPPEAHRRRGRSLVRLLEDNQAPEPRSAVCVGRDGVQCASFRDGRYTLVWTNTPEGELTELYDRGLDPLELRDLAVWRPQLVQKLRNELVWLLTEVEL